MGKGGNVFKPNIAPDPFMVCMARNMLPISSLIIGRLFEIEQVTFEGRSKTTMSLFFEKLLVVIILPGTFLPWQLSASKGLYDLPVAPAVLPSCFFESWVSVVSMTMG